MWPKSNKPTINVVRLYEKKQGVMINLVDAGDIQANRYVYSPLNESGPLMGNFIFPNPNLWKTYEVSHIRLVSGNGDLILLVSHLISYYRPKPVVAMYFLMCQVLMNFPLVLVDLEVINIIKLILLPCFLFVHFN